MTEGKPELELSIVIPTRNEVANVDRLLERIAALPASQSLHVIFVDDSDDGTPDAIATTDYPLDVSVIHRKPRDRVGGLGAAVVIGLKAAKTDWVCVMDGDLQHPPMVVAELLHVAQQRQTDVVVAARRGTVKGPSGLSVPRQLLSRVSALMARAMFPSTLRGVSDPMSGFFLIRRSALDLDRLRPIGFKILLEILVTHPLLRVTESPYRFEQRNAGVSNANLREGLRYTAHLLTLRLRSWRGAR